MRQLWKQEGRPFFWSLILVLIFSGSLFFGQVKFLSDGVDLSVCDLGRSPRLTLCVGARGAYLMAYSGRGKMIWDFDLYSR